MARQQIMFDKTEIVAGFPAGKRYQVLNLSYDDIQRIQFDRIQERKLWKKVPSEKITIVTGKYGQPIVYTKLKHQEHWSMYKEKLAEFAERNHITFADNT